jgi:hypothetical protein
MWKIAHLRYTNRACVLGAVLCLLVLSAIAEDAEKVQPSGRTVIAEVVAMNQPFMVNRLGASVPTGQIFALRNDVQTMDGKVLPSYADQKDLTEYIGKVTLKDYKRPRPIVLRVNVGDILEVRFNNLLVDVNQTWTAKPYAGFHIMGLNLLPSPDDKPASPPSLGSDSSWVGKNANSFAGQNPKAPGAPQVYRYFADAEGVFIIYSAADPTSSNEIANGLFGCVTVQPPEAEYYRSQVTRADLVNATYYSENLPPNMVLYEQVNSDGSKHYFLTTYETRLRDYPIKNVEVTIREVAPKLPKYGYFTQEPQNFLYYFSRDLETNEVKPWALTEPLPKGVQNLQQAKQTGQIIPKGWIYAAEPAIGHPIIDYSIAYGEGGSRPKGWPVLRMLYPVATDVLKAKSKNDKFGVNPGDDVLRLKKSQDSKKSRELYNEAITQLDEGVLPETLKEVLETWGVGISDLTRVSAERSYYDPKQRFSTIGEGSYIWLLTGVNVSGKENSAILIHGNGEAFTLHFIEVELQLFYSDPTAIITGPQAGRFRYSQDSPSFYQVPAMPDRREPYREFALAYHNPPVIQAFPAQSRSSPLKQVLGNGDDQFAINYGIAGIGAEVLANRLGVGPEGINKDEVDLKFEEFFLSSWAVGDPAMLVDRPANTPNQAVLPPGNEKPRNDTSNWVAKDKWQVTDPVKNPPESKRASKVFFPDDPSNVYHSYIHDHVKMRIYNAGTNAPHVHHLHAHQWLRSPNSDQSAYLDSELIVPGSTFSLDMTYGGSGNRNETVGDSIFHCHFYPHFAKGMWALWRVHDVFEEGTPLTADGKVAASNEDYPWVRSLPDGEIGTGTPIPAIVPLPGIGMAPYPAKVRVAKLPEINNPNSEELGAWVNVKQSMGRVVQVEPEYVYKRNQAGEIMRNAIGLPEFAYELDQNGKEVPKLLHNEKGELVYRNPGFPFFVPGVAGHRPPHPPMGMAWEEKKDGTPDLVEEGPNTGSKKYLDGGLPRHQVLGGQIVREFHTLWDFTKDFIRYETDSTDPSKELDDHPNGGALVACRIPEDGTPIEKAAMKAQSTRTYATVQPDGTHGNFIRNGLPPVPGAPFANPSVDDYGNEVNELLKYKAAVIQKDVVFNKAGWHYPQERSIMLWQDVKPTFDNKRPSQPFFFRANGGETVEFWKTNLVPDYYELDDFQVRTPTDIIGQHIHLVKFDVTSSDGAVNGFNYEDGSMSPADVRGRIYAITRPWVDQPELKYNLFAFNNAESQTERGIATVDWSRFAFEKPLKITEWEGSYLQSQMSQGPSGEKNPLKPPNGQNWDGAMTSVSRFSTDPLLNNKGHDRTVRTVFTHDHFGPSTHQQAGLYGGLLVEPADSTWRDPVTGGIYYDTVNRSDGGPTGWEAIIETVDPAKSYREFALEFQDLQLAYTNESPGDLKHVPDQRDPGNRQKFPPVIRVTLSDDKQAPAAGKPVKEILVIDPFDNNNAISLQQNLNLCGITLTNEAKFTEPDASGIVDEGEGSLYYYGKGVAAFSVIVVPDKERLQNKKPEYFITTPRLQTWADPDNAVNPPGRYRLVPQLVSGPLIPGGVGTYSVNYRSEPLSVPWHYSSPKTGAPVPDKSTGRMVIPNASPAIPPEAKDMSYAFASITRLIPWNNTLPALGKDGHPNTHLPSLFMRPRHVDDLNGDWYDPVGFASSKDGVSDGKISNYDPYTPLLRGYQNDRVQIRALVGAHTLPHSFTIHGVKWLYEPDYPDSGYRNAHRLGISEHMEMNFTLPPATVDQGRIAFADYLYAASSGIEGLQNGLWGIMRSYDPKRAPLKTVGAPATPSESPTGSLYRLPEAANARPYRRDNTPTAFVYPKTPDVEFTITAQKSPIIYNKGIGDLTIANPNGIVYTVDEVAVKVGEKLVPKGVTTLAGQPLVLRAKAGDWVKIKLKNRIPTSYAASPNGSPTVSTAVGLHSQLVAYDANGSDGANVGFNIYQTVAGSPDGIAVQPAAPGVDEKEYWWYAGDFVTDKDGWKRDDDGHPVVRPRELGAINLSPAAPIGQDANGLVGALVVEPQNSSWADKDFVSTSASIYDSEVRLMFKDFVIIEQNNTLPEWLGPPDKAPTPSAIDNQSADLTYRRLANPEDKPARVLSNTALRTTNADGVDPNTPIFEANAGDPIRFRVLMPGGNTSGPNGSPMVFEIHGHSWQEEPYVNDAGSLGSNPNSQVLGAEMIVPHLALNILIDKAGGAGEVPGDYLYYNYLQKDGAWGILRVHPKPKK